MAQHTLPRIKLGVVGHFSLAVEDPDRSAAFWQMAFDLQEIFRYEGGVAISNEAITIALFKGKPAPDALEHMSFHLPSVAALKEALAVLKAHHVAVEDPGDEIGPEGPGSPHLGLWFHDPDGYRWELSVLNGAREARP